MNDFEIGGHMSKRHLFDKYFKIMSSQYIDKCHFHCRLGFNLQKKIEKENGVNECRINIGAKCQRSQYWNRPKTYIYRIGA